ncbi:4-hydroxy-tetrahydrodipicolinate reductase [Thermomonas sp.]|uniref:4-hydroxy-tetrahydrodipicolinate reductase n=1 Tax=Thermomonas sp. TaxID=1971895 RepID=UPI002488CCD9|nr:4-hydroxy-tetrahydrodipicolinate reductase [Thermomonas sp.]MDI1253345.1 4-hydroxy-tetrahydrodipicolinate reductase [Thermomonas sp.]
MTDFLHVLIHGANGRMGQALLRLAAGDAACDVVGAVSRSVDARVVDGIPRFAVSELQGVPEFDVAIDFSQPDGFDAILELCVARNKPLVSGTTGLSVHQFEALDAASARIATMWASNFSLGVAVLHDLVERAARVLPGWDCDIIETHHSRKIDAPSGTALTLGDSAAQGGATPHYAWIRAGDIVGEHCVQFTSTGERIELIHRASNRDIFAAGALHVAHALHGRNPGRYRMIDLLD